MDLGILWMNKYTKGLDYMKVVEGISGGESSFNVMYLLAKFVLESLTLIKGKEETEGFDTLCELIANKVYLKLILQGE